MPRTKTLGIDTSTGTFHLHTDALAKQILEIMHMPALNLDPVINNSQCLRGTTDQLSDALHEIAGFARQAPIEVPSNDLITTNPAQAIADLAVRIAGEGVTVGEINSALEFVLMSLRLALNGPLGEQIGYLGTDDWFTAYDLDRRAAMAFTELKKAEDESAFRVAKAAVENIEEQCWQRLGRGVFRFYQSTWHQASTIIDGKRSDKLTTGVRFVPMLLKNLAEAHGRDGKCVRSDKEFDQIVAATSQQYGSAKAQQEKITRGLEQFVAALMNGQKPETNIEFDQKFAVNFDDWSTVNVSVRPGPMPKSFSIMVIGLNPENPDDFMELLTTALQASR